MWLKGVAANELNSLGRGKIATLMEVVPQQVCHCGIVLIFLGVKKLYSLKHKMYWSTTCVWNHWVVMMTHASDGSTWDSTSILCYKTATEISFCATYIAVKWACLFLIREHCSLLKSQTSPTGRWATCLLTRQLAVQSNVLVHASVFNVLYLMLLSQFKHSLHGRWQLPIKVSPRPTPPFVAYLGI